MFFQVLGNGKKGLSNETKVIIGQKMSNIIWPVYPTNKWYLVNDFQIFFSFIITMKKKPQHLEYILCGAIHFTAIIHWLLC